MRHFEPHAPYKAVKSYATRAELVCSRRPTNHRLFATFGIVNEACIFAHFHHYDEEEARAHTARKVDKKWGSDIARRTTQTRFSFVAVITSRFRLAKHACWNARDYEELVLRLVKNTPIPAAQWIPAQEHVNRRS